MRDGGDTKSPPYTEDVHEIGSLSAYQLPHQGSSLATSNILPPVSAPGKVAAISKRDEATDFRILVAARIRPFTELEVRQWQQERRASVEDSGDAVALRGSFMRSSTRHPFGPGHKSLNASPPVATISPGAAHSQELGAVHPDAGQPSLHTQSTPMPVVEVEDDGRTIVLLDPQRQSTDPNATAPVRNAFTYDCVFSSFAPVVTAGPCPKGSLALSSAPVPQAASGELYSITNETQEGFPNPALWSSFSTNALEHERQAEAEQVAIYKHLAIPLVDTALQGYNTCMFAYGQTGSGKTYTMVGTPEHPGLIPRLCQLLFTQVAMRNAEVHDGGAASSSTQSAAMKLQLSYMEIYNEQVRDLLKQRPKNAIVRYRSRFDKKGVDSEEYRALKVRHHPSKGIYVEGLTAVSVSTWVECEELFQHGNALRTQCSTAINAKSSRSHAIFQLTVTRHEATGGRVRGRDVTLETSSKINLVDLAGSERNTNSKTTGKHLAEANSINASLSTLRRVLSGLVSNRGGTASSNSQSNTGGSKQKKNFVVPYRESLLTYVLSDNLGGNSFTVMCANVSPGASNISETESTLRYAMLARSVVNHARIDKTPTARVIREMREQIKIMQEAFQRAPNPAQVSELKEGILLSEQLLREMRVREDMYESRLRSNQVHQKELQKALETYQAGEAYWRAEAQRQQERVESLRAALVAATTTTTTSSSSNVADAIADCGEEKPKIPPSGPREASLEDPVPRHPWLSQDAARAPPISTDERSRNGTAANATPSPSSKRKKWKPARQYAGLHGKGGSGGRDAAASFEASTDLCPAVSHVPRPSETRGSPLSLIGLREEVHLHGVVLPHLRSGSVASAPYQVHHEGSRRPAPSAVPRQQTNAKSPSQQQLSNTPSWSEGVQRHPRPPPQKPEYHRLSHTTLSLDPSSKQRRSPSPKPPETVTGEKALGTPPFADGSSGLSGRHRGGKGSGTVGRGVDYLSEGPSYHESNTHSPAAIGTTEIRLSLSTSSDAVPFRGGHGIDRVANNADGRKGLHNSSERRVCRGSDVADLQGDTLEMYKQRGTSEKLQPHQLTSGQSDNRIFDNHPGIEGDTATPASSPLASKSARIPEACQPKRRRDHHCSSVTDESSLSKQSAKRLHSIARNHSRDQDTPRDARRLSTPRRSPQEKQRMYSEDVKVISEANVGVRGPLHRQSTFSAPVEKKGSYAYRHRFAHYVDGLSQLYEGKQDCHGVAMASLHPHHCSNDADLDVGEEEIRASEVIAGTLPAIGAYRSSGHHLVYPTVEAASDAVASVAAAIVPSSGHMLPPSTTRKRKQSGGRHTREHVQIHLDA
ncbi:hypothetical protein JKF63_06725 [Porcisia hertigi]|uniref:Kinesin motor domain-containing protein n=1 Tax=Porcisia hertigi TaxID=2761500 RepID=A0A836IPG4_9TRYP|nr:hypothetical protein JKF63_06725 [Porcisia hertigi]